MPNNDLIRWAEAIEAVYYNPYSPAVGVIKKVSAVDAVEVVRCRDCTHWAGPDDGMVHGCYLDALCRPGDWFCAGGARRADDGK